MPSNMRVKLISWRKRVCPKMITIATNMAGRGTDIVLGGNVEKPIELLRMDESMDDATREQRMAELREEWKANS